MRPLLTTITLSLFAATLGGCSAAPDDAEESSDDLGALTFRTLKEKRQIATVDGPILFDTSTIRVKSSNAALDAEVNAHLAGMVDDLARATARPEVHHADTVVVQAVSLNYAGLLTITQTVTFPASHRGSRSAVTFDLRKARGTLVGDFGAFVDPQGRKMLRDRCVEQSCASWLESAGVRVYSRSYDGAAEASSVVPYSLLSPTLIDARLKRLAEESRR